MKRPLLLPRISPAAVLLAALGFLPAAADARRVAAPKAPPLIHNGVRYFAPNDDGRRAYVQAWDVKSRKMLWEATIFRNRIRWFLEEDVQHVYITRMSVRDRVLIIAAEKGGMYQLDLKTRAVKKLSASPAK